MLLNGNFRMCHLNTKAQASYTVADSHGVHVPPPVQCPGEPLEGWGLVSGMIIHTDISEFRIEVP